MGDVAGCATAVVTGSTMPRHRMRSTVPRSRPSAWARMGSTLLAGMLLVALLAACIGDPSGPDPTTGSVRITVTTTGPDEDTEYTLTSGGTSLTIAANTSITITDLLPGTAPVTISDVAGNCTVTGSTTRSVTVTAGATTDVTFVVVCAAMTLADVSGTWLFYDERSLLLPVWWVFELEQDNGVVTGETQEGLQVVPFLSETYRLPGGRPISGVVQPDSVVTLVFDYDNTAGLDTIVVRVTGDGVMGARSIEAERVTHLIPAAPTDFTATPESATSIRLTWNDASTTEYAFEIHRRCCGEPYVRLEDVRADAEEGDTETILDTGLAPDVTYEYRIIAYWKAELWNHQNLFVRTPEPNPETSATTPRPVGITSIEPTSGIPMTTATLSGWGFEEVASMTLGTVDAGFFRFVGFTDTTTQLFVPNAGSAGAHELVVTRDDGWADTIMWTQEGDVDATEPNDDPADATDLGTWTGGFWIAESFVGADEQDFFRFTLTSTTSFDATLIWNTDTDLDVLVQPAATAVPWTDPAIPPPGDVCGYSGATNEPFETLVCDDLPAGDYVIHIVDFDAIESGDDSPKSYYITAAERGAPLAPPAMAPLSRR